MNYAIQKSMKQNSFCVAYLDYTITVTLVFFKRSVSNNSDTVDPVLEVQTVYYNEEQAVQVYLGGNKES